MAGRDDRHLSMRARNATTRLTEYTATRVRYKARYIRKSSHTVRSGSSVHWGPEQFTRLAAGTGTSLARRQFVSLPRKQTVSSLLVTYPNIQGRRCRYASRHRTHHSWPMWPSQKGGEGGIEDRIPMALSGMLPRRSVSCRCHWLPSEAACCRARR